MDIGIGLFTCRQRPDDNRSHTERYQEIVELTRVADEVGLSSAWVSEHHFMNDGYLSGVIPMMAAMTAVTDNIEIGSYVALPPFYDSIRLAEDAATISLLSGGRLTLGIGIGQRDAEFEGFGITKDERVERTVDAISVMRSAWSPGPIDSVSKYHDIPPDMPVSPTPDIPPKIIIGALAKPAVRRAARLSEGWAAGVTLSVQELNQRINDIARVRAQYNLTDEFTTYVPKYGFVADSKEEAWEQMRDGYLFTQRAYSQWHPSDYTPWSDYHTDQFDDDDEWVQKVKEKAIYGTPEQVVSDIEAFCDQLDSDIHFIFRLYHPGLNTDVMTECIERLGTEVVPKLQ